MSNSIPRGAVMYPSPMTVNVINFDDHLTDMTFDIYEMSLSDNGTLTNPFQDATGVNDFA